MQITQAAKELNQKNLRLVAIVKERAGWEEFTRDYWPSPAEIYFDTYEPDFPFFAAANGKKQGVVGMLVSGMFGGEVANNLKRAQHIAGNSDGDDSILGSVVVVSSKGEVLFLHKENVPGDHPNDEKMRDAMQVAVEQLGGTGVVSCECDEDKKNRLRTSASSLTETHVGPQPNHTSVAA